MSDHPSAKQIEDYLQKKLNPTDLIRVDEHLAHCNQCRGSLNVDVEAVVRSLEEEFVETRRQHLTYEQIMDVVTNESGADREVVSEHLKSCPQCQAEYEDLIGFTRELKGTAKGRVYKWVATVAAMLALFGLIVTLTNRESPVEQKQQARTSIPAVITIQDYGTNLILDREGKLSGLKAPKVYLESVRRALENTQVEVSPDVKSLITTRGVLRGESEDGMPFSLLKPVGTFVMSDQPEFEWKPLAGATAYRATVLDLNMKTAAESQWIKATQWKPSSSLKRDETYIWQVAAIRNGTEIRSPVPPAGEARFRIVDQQTYDQLVNSQKLYSNSRLLLALIYAENGLLDEAVQNLQQLIEKNPSSPHLKALIKDVESLR